MGFEHGGFPVSSVVGHVIVKAPVGCSISNSISMDPGRAVGINGLVNGSVALTLDSWMSSGDLPARLSLMICSRRPSHLLPKEGPFRPALFQPLSIAAESVTTLMTWAGVSGSVHRSTIRSPMNSPV